MSGSSAERIFASSYNSDSAIYRFFCKLLLHSSTSHNFPAVFCPMSGWSADRGNFWSLLSNTANPFTIDFPQATSTSIRLTFLIFLTRLSFVYWERDLLFPPIKCKQWHSQSLSQLLSILPLGLTSMSCLSQVHLLTDRLYVLSYKKWRVLPPPSSLSSFCIAMPGLTSLMYLITSQLWQPTERISSP